MSDVVFDIERLQALVFGEIKPAFDIEDTILYTDTDVTFFHPRHFKDDRQGILRFVDVGGWKKNACRNCRLLAFFLLPLLLNLQLLSLVALLKNVNGREWPLATS